MKSNQQKNNNKRHAAGIIIMFLICTAATATGCHRSSGDFPHNVTVISGAPTPTPAAAPTDMPSPAAALTDTPTAFSTSAQTPSSEPTAASEPTTAPEPTATTAPAGEASFSTPTPTQVPYEGYVIGKDVNNNELKMTPQEADDFVMAGNILKLYDGSWFDIDDDGEPEYVSIQPYECWTDTDQCYHIVFSGYDWIPLEVVAGDDRQDIPRENDVFVCITSMDGITKEIITFGTDTIGGDSWTRSEYYVFRSENKQFISCGWLGCSISEFRLDERCMYSGKVVFTDSSFAEYFVINGKFWFDGKKICTALSEVDWDFISNPLNVSIDKMKFKNIDNCDYFTALLNEPVRLYQIEVNKEIEDYCNQRYLTGYNYTYRYFDNLEISMANPEVGENIKLYFEKVSTGEKGWIIEKKGYPYSADEKERYYGGFGYYHTN